MLAVSNLNYQEPSQMYISRERNLHQKIDRFVAGFKGRSDTYIKKTENGVKATQMQKLSD